MICIQKLKQLHMNTKEKEEKIKLINRNKIMISNSSINAEIKKYIYKYICIILIN